MSIDVEDERPPDNKKVIYTLCFDAKKLSE